MFLRTPNLALTRHRVTRFESSAVNEERSKVSVAKAPVASGRELGADSWHRRLVKPDAVAQRTQSLDLPGAAPWASLPRQLRGETGVALWLTSVVPVKRGQLQPRGEEGHLDGRVLETAGLEQEHTRAAVRRESVGQNAARRAGAHWGGA
ncbi:hypothetical protein V5799_020302, partial [Amblyomma americanum]